MLLGGVGIGWGLAQAGLIRTTVGSHSPIATVPQIGVGGQSTQTLDPQAIANKVTPAIVDINTVIGGVGQSSQAAGTGMILTSSGEVLTNNHVVEGSTKITVTIQGRSNTYTAKVVGVSPSQDVALIQIQGVSGLPTVTLANSSTLQVGQSVVAMGNALGQGGAPFTSGTITALDQSITASSGGTQTENLSGLIQSDAPIQPGDSGGALVNSAGQVIGMITAGETQGFRQTTSTVGYAIPSNSAVSVVNQIRSGNAGNGVIIGETGYLGVEVRDVTPSASAALNITSGALITGVASGSPAEKIGLAMNAVITAIDGATIASSNDLGPAIHAHKPGDHIKVSWVDQNGTHTGTATLSGGGPAA